MADSSFKPYRTYPQSVPFQAPPELAAREARLRRWTYGLAGSAALLLILLTAGGVFLVKYLQDRADAPSSDKQEQQPADEKDGAARAKALEQQAARNEAARKELAAMEKALADKERAVAEREKALAGKNGKVKDRIDRLLQTVGLLTTGHLYQSFVNIGLLADGMEKKLYEKEQALRLLGEVSFTLNQVDSQLKMLQKMDLEPDDAKDVQQIRDLIGLLQDQARELKAYWEEPTPEQTKKYQKAREVAWNSLKPLLGGEEKK